MDSNFINIPQQSNDEGGNNIVIDSENEEEEDFFYMDVENEHTESDSKLKIGTSYILSEPLCESTLKSVNSSMNKIRQLSSPGKRYRPMETQILRSSTNLFNSPMSSISDYRNEDLGSLQLKDLPSGSNASEIENKSDKVEIDSYKEKNDNSNNDTLLQAEFEKIQADVYLLYIYPSLLFIKWYLIKMCKE